MVHNIQSLFFIFDIEGPVKFYSSFLCSKRVSFCGGYPSVTKKIEKIVIYCISKYSSNVSFFFFNSLYLFFWRGATCCLLRGAYLWRMNLGGIIIFEVPTL